MGMLEYVNADFKGSLGQGPGPMAKYPLMSAIRDSASRAWAAAIGSCPGIKLLKRPSIILFCGHPASGKTTAMVSVICQIVEFKRPAFGRFYVSTKFSGDFTFAPDEDIFEDYTQQHLEEYVNKIKAWKKRNPKKDVPQNILVIDDAMGQINWYSRFWSSLISTHRHWGMNILVATQSLTAGGHGSSAKLCCATVFIWQCCTIHHLSTPKKTSS